MGPLPSYSINNPPFLQGKRFAVYHKTPSNGGVITHDFVIAPAGSSNSGTGAAFSPAVPGTAQQACLTINPQ
jgi:hypothetical protein